ncbi:MAG TPA: NAD(P)-dependent oxidoreductase, partial [Hyphomicrobiaceae bacterium]|nr:NAD(P)-dependent oxidoreductase [Hyphomicrobiaceae bacterium]
MALLIACSSRAEQFAAEILALDPELDIRIAPDVGDVADIDTALVWQPPPGLLRTLPNLKLIVSVGAGVDALVGDPTLPYVPLVRFVDPDLTGRMVEYIVLNVLYHHRRMAEFRELQTRRVWEYLPEPAAQDVRVGVMGLGVLGAAAAQALKPFDYQVRGWSRTSKTLDGITCYHGTTQLEAFLADTDILAVLLPLTPDTRG